MVPNHALHHFVLSTLMRSESRVVIRHLTQENALGDEAGRGDNLHSHAMKQGY